VETSNDKRIFIKEDAEEKFVAVIDILGFSSKVLGDFEQSLDVFENVISRTDSITDVIKDVEIRIYSDSYIITGETFGRVVAATQVILWRTLMEDLLVRGGIAKGQHIDIADSKNLYMVSEAVARASAVEKTVKYPCVAIHPDLEIPMEWWGGAIRNLDRGILYFGGLVIVNPCGTYWGDSARYRVTRMLQENPTHREKYEWFLEMHKAIFSPVPMVPPEIFYMMEDRARKEDKGKNTGGGADMGCGDGE
jgi:hypothetical protein